MDRALYLSMSGAKQNMQELQLRANNLANVNTNGFRADLAQARSMQAYGDGFPSRVFSMVERPGNNFAQGSVNTTGRDLDIVIQGEGWISVMDSEGQEGLTRNGSFEVSSMGVLMNGQGHLVLNSNGAPITLPTPLAKIVITPHGTVSVLPMGAPPEEMEEVAQIKLVNPDKRELFKDNNGLFRLKTNEQNYVQDGSIRVLSGAIEGSNVKAVEEMTNLIDLQRQFEMQVKLMSTAEEMDASSERLMRMS